MLTIKAQPHGANDQGQSPVEQIRTFVSTQYPTAEIVEENVGLLRYHLRGEGGRDLSVSVCLYLPFLSLSAIAVCRSFCLSLCFAVFIYVFLSLCLSVSPLTCLQATSGFSTHRLEPSSEYV